MKDKEDWGMIGVITYLINTEAIVTKKTNTPTDNS